MLKPVAALILASITMFVVPSFARAECPVINGKYKMPVYKDGTLLGHRTLTFITRVEGEKFSYQLGNENGLQLADGVMRPYRKGDREGKMRFECDRDSLLQVIQAADTGTVWWIRVIVLSRFELKAESNSSELAGIYTKEL